MIKVIRFEEVGKEECGSRTQFVKALVSFDCADGESERDSVSLSLTSVSGCALRGYDSALEALDDWFILTYDGERPPRALRASEASGEMAAAAAAVLAHRNAMW